MGEPEPHSFLVRLVLAAGLLLSSIGCGPDGGEATSSTASAGDWFVDRARESGLEFTHVNGMTGELYFAEIMGSGGALFDYDRDGDLDVYLVQGGPLEAAAGPTNYGDRLFRNELVESGTLRFTDVTQAAGIEAYGYGMGAAVGDVDRDGWPDLYVTNFGPNQLWLNRGDGTFGEAAAASGADDDRWTTSALFWDFDADGSLDLFLCNYVDFTVARNEECYAASGARDYCSPARFDSSPDRLLRNLGDGTFKDITGSSGLASDFGACLGAIDGDFNGDGRRDLYVANDGLANQLWINRDGSRFENTALLAGCAFNRDGEAEASMGVDAADFDDDGDDDLFMTHLAKETNTLFRNDGKGWFDDATVELGLGLSSHSATGFGVAWIDIDNDGRLDLIVANGAVTAIEEQVQAGDSYPLDQPNQLFRQTEAGRFEDVSREAGSLFELEEVSRAVIVGDIDNDGDPDALITNNSGPVRLALNESGGGNHWLGLRLIDDAVGGYPPSAEVIVVRRDGSVLRRRVRVGGSYLAANDPRVLVGLGRDRAFRELRVVWPDGSSEAWDEIEVDRYHTLRKGDGRS